jgi:protein-L-isoaspartate(D-aspartate) O-methyltransferase
MRDNEQLITNLQKWGLLKTPNIIDAFKAINRIDFVTSKGIAYCNLALPIGCGQTISSPEVVAFMLELLAPNLHEKILEIGSGSGWVTALLAHCVGVQGTVIGLEIVPDLVKIGQHNLSKYKLPQAKILAAEYGVLGIPEADPFDKIIVSAASNDLPLSLLTQFKQKLVIPIQNSIWLLEKSDDKLRKFEFPGFAFVPLITSNNK